jgi:hypothetical protein
MYKFKKWFFRRLFKILGKSPLDMPMVRYWKTKDKVAAKVFTGKDGAVVMKMEGEDELFPGFPRGFSLFGTLSKLKHEIKNQIFNEAWALLEANKPEQAMALIKAKMTGGLQEYVETLRYDMVPPSKLCKPVRELWRVLTIMEKKEPKLKFFKEALCFITQEDDAYRFRLMWLVQIFKPRWWTDPVKLLRLALEELEHGEVVGDMKERVRLWRRIMLFALEDPKILALFKEFCSLTDFNKLKLTKADKYHFRAKWFKVDFMLFEY